jgi:hypothetical protein
VGKPLVKRPPKNMGGGDNIKNVLNFSFGHFSIAWLLLKTQRLGSWFYFRCDLQQQQKVTC